MSRLSSSTANIESAKQVSANQKYTEFDLSRVMLFGPRASGKSTVSVLLAKQLNLAYLEFDVIRRKQDGSPACESDYTKALMDFVQQRRWIVDGDYLEGIDRLALPIVWPLATTAIWLDLPFLTTMHRLVTRSHRRVNQKEVMWGNKQDKKSSMLKRLASGNAVRAYWAAKKAYPVLLQKPEYSHLGLLHLKTQSDVDELLSSIIAGGKPG